MSMRGDSHVSCSVHARVDTGSCSISGVFRGACGRANHMLYGVGYQESVKSHRLRGPGRFSAPGKKSPFSGTNSSKVATLRGVAMGITKESSASLSSLTLGSRNPSKQFFDFAAEIVSTEFLYICVIWSISRDLSSSESWMMQ